MTKKNPHSDAYSIILVDSYISAPNGTGIEMKNASMKTRGLRIDAGVVGINAENCWDIDAEVDINISKPKK